MARARLLLVALALAATPLSAGASMPSDVYRGVAPAFDGAPHEGFCSGGCVEVAHAADPTTGAGALRIAEDINHPNCCGNFNLVYANFVRTHEVPAASSIDYRLVVKINSAHTDPAGLLPFRPTGGFVTMTVRLWHHCGCAADITERIELVTPGQDVTNQERTFDFRLTGLSDLLGNAGPVPAGRVFASVLFEAEAYHNGVDNPTVADISFTTKKLGYRAN